MQKCAECAELVPKLMEFVMQGSPKKILDQAKKISQVEHEADVIKNGIREKLHSEMFIPVDRRDLLSLLHNQDAVADVAEDIGVLFTLRDTKIPDDLKAVMNNLLGSCLLVVRESNSLIGELDLLLEASFSGPERDTVLKMIESISRNEHLADKAQTLAAKKLFKLETTLSAGAIIILSKSISEIGNLANRAENIANSVRLLLSK